MTTTDITCIIPLNDQTFPGEVSGNLPALLSFPVFYQWVSMRDPDIDIRVLWKSYDHCLNRLLKLCVQSHRSGEGLN